MKLDLHIKKLSADQNIANGKEIFFQQYPFMHHQGFDTCYVFSMRNEVTDVPVIQITFILIDGEMISLPRCPFAGFQSRDPSLSLTPFIAFIKEQSLMLGAKKLVIKQFPPIYDEQCVRQIKSALKDQLLYSDINQHIDINGFDPESSLHKMQQRRVTRCLDRNFIFRKEQKDSAPEIHAFIAMCRENQGIKVNISLEHFLKTIDTFPHQYNLFTIRDDENIIATTVTVRVNASVIYNYLPASDSTYGRYSPMVFLISKIVEYYRFKQYEILDLGISSIEGKEQTGLRGFKHRIGALESKKDVYEILL